LFLEEEVSFLPTNDNIVGIDLGLEDFVVFSTGEKVKAPKILRKYQSKLALLQRRLAKKQKQSKRRNIAGLKVAKIHKNASFGLKNTKSI
jgi:putative transposase